MFVDIIGYLILTPIVDPSNHTEEKGLIPIIHQPPKNPHTLFKSLSNLMNGDTRVQRHFIDILNRDPEVAPD